MADAGTTIFKHSIGKPTKTGKVAMKVEFRSDGGTKFKEGVVVDIDKDDTAVEKSAKIVAALNAKIAARNEGKGAEATQGKLVFPSGTEIQLPEIYVTNLKDFRVTKVVYDSKKTGETIKKRKIKLAMVDPGEGSSKPGEDSQETALVVFQGAPTQGSVTLAVGDNSIARVTTADQSNLNIVQALVSQITEARGFASVEELKHDDSFGEDHWDFGVMISELKGDAIFVDVDDDGMGYAISLFDSAEG